MPLSDKDRKLLWGRAGNRCSYRFREEICGEALSVEDSSKDVVVGEECHIVGEKPGAARYRSDFPDRDAYPNRVLLCRKHHKIVDENEQLYSVDMLCKMKKTHEKAIDQATDDEEGAAERVVIKDSTFSTTAEHTKRAVGMEVNRPAVLSGVRSDLRVSNVEEAIGFSTNQGMMCALVICSRCNRGIPLTCTGPRPPSVTCPHCGNEQTYEE